jgi:hypothetical protein
VTGGGAVIGGGSAVSANTIDGTGNGIVVGQDGDRLNKHDATTTENISQRNRDHLGGAVDTVIGTDVGPGGLAT